jgi:hypothetical protein
MTTSHAWREMQPNDGYFAVLQVEGQVKASLIFGVFLNGTTVKHKLIAEHDFPTARVIGELKRQLIFWEGVAEYMNAGGELERLRDDIEDISAEFSGRIQFRGWSYFDTGINPLTGNRVHEFISDAPEHQEDPSFVRWVRGEYIDVNLTIDSMSEVDNCGANDTPPPEAEDLREIGFSS